MLGKFKSGAGEKDQGAAPAAKAVAPTPPPAAAATSAAEKVSVISAGVTVIGKLIGDGTVKIYGRVEGELQAASLLISDGAIVEGNVVAQDVTVGGRVKGTIHALRVELKGTSVVEGDIYHRSLAVEENARFEGSSRRESNLTEAAAEVLGAGASPLSQAQTVLGDSNGKYNGTPGTTDLHPAE